MKQIKDFPAKSQADNTDLLVVQDASGITRKITREAFLLGVGGSGSVTSPTAVTSNLILDLRFTERTGQIINDNSGNNYHGTSGNSNNSDFQDIKFPSWLNSGIELFQDDYVYLPTANYFNGNLTVEIAFFQRNYAAWARLFDFGQGQALHNVLLSCSSNGSGRLHFDIVGNNQYSNPVVAPEPTRLFTWNYVCLTLEGSIGSIYQNCSLIAQGELLIPQNVSRNNCFLGRSNWSGEAYFDGLLGMFRIYNRVLTTTERINNFKQSQSWLRDRGIVI